MAVSRVPSWNGLIYQEGAVAGPPGLDVCQQERPMKNTTSQIRGACWRQELITGSMGLEISNSMLTCLLLCIFRKPEQDFGHRHNESPSTI